MGRKTFVILTAALVLSVLGCYGQKQVSFAGSESLKTVWLDELDISKATSGLKTTQHWFARRFRSAR